jgi:hypothetical protein
VGQAVCFRYAFQLPRLQARASAQYKLEVTTPDNTATVWINGQELPAPAEKPRGGKREYWIPPLPTPAAGGPPGQPPDLKAAGASLLRLRAGRNVIAVRVDPDSATDGAEFLKVRLDEMVRPTVATSVGEEVVQRLVTDRAVVCDLCSSQFGQVPACVNACPHDAAMRVDARVNLPGT